MTVSKVERRLALATLLGASLILLALCVCSTGAYHEDGLTHFMIARGTAHFAENWFDAWGRPGATAFFAPFAIVPDPALAWVFARLASAAAIVLIAWAAYRTAVRLGLERPAWAAAAVVIQPLAFRLGYETMTEVPCALWLALAIERASAGRMFASAMWLSPCFITRFETLVFVPVWLWAAWPRDVTFGDVRRVAMGALALAWAPVAMEAAAFATGNPSVLRVLLEPAPTGGAFYGRASVAWTPVNWLLAVGPLVGLAAIAGIPSMIGHAAGRLATGAGVAYVGAHTVLFSLNLFASGGYPRFQVVVAAPSALLAVAGIQRLRRGGASRVVRAGTVAFAIAGAAAAVVLAEFVEKWPWVSIGWTWGMRLALAFAAVCAGLAIVSFIRRVSPGWNRRIARGVVGCAVVAQAAVFAAFVRGPTRLDDGQRSLVDAAHWVRRQPWVGPTTAILGSRDWVDYALDRPRPVGDPFPWDALDSAAPGTVYVCDVHPADWRIRVGARTVRDYETDPGFETVYTVGRGASRVAVFVRR